MDTALLVDHKIEDGQRIVERLLREQFSVPVAFWVRRTEEGALTLNIGSDAIDPKELRDKYRVVYATLDLIPGCSIGASEINLLTRSDPLARDAIALRDRYPGTEPRSHRNVTLAKTQIDEVIIYPKRFPL